MAENRVSKYLEQESKQHGEDWMPTTQKEKEDLCRNVTHLMMITLLDHKCMPGALGLVPGIVKMKEIAMVVIDMSILTASIKNVNFLTALELSMGIVVTLMVSDLIQAADFKKF